MSDELLLQQINALVNGTISEADHRELQDRLKSDVTARALFLERMDLEAGLRTWAADGLLDEQTTANTARPTKRPVRSWLRWKVTLLATAASILAIAIWWTQQPDRAQPEVAEQHRHSETPEPTPSAILLGRLVQQADCVWEQGPSLQEDRFSPGTIKLTAGAVELRFDSGTNIILEAPCEVKIETVDSAELLAGTVYVDVTEISNGFRLETPEARIIDEGTQYAVSLDSQATEVHVFDGSVIWTSVASDSDFEERIPSGEARRYLRSDPGRSRHIPFGQRQFVQRIEDAVRDAGGGNLLAYDGFENLAGQLRRGRSGFGWSGGWESAGRGRGPLAEVVDAPDDVVFGLDRSGRRQLLLRSGDSLRRRFENPISIESGATIFLSLLVSRQPSVGAEGSSLQIVLEPESDSPRYNRRHSLTFGITSDGQPFVNNAGAIAQSATSMKSGEPLLLVLKYASQGQNSAAASLRIYRQGDLVDSVEPSVWTVHGGHATGTTRFASLRVSVGAGYEAQLDELRIGNSWNAAVSLAN